MKKKHLLYCLLLFTNPAFFYHSGISQTIAGGLKFSLSVCLDSTIKGWGYNYYGQVGAGDTIDKHAPVPVSGLTGITAVDAGEWHRTGVPVMIRSPRFAAAG